MYKHTVSRRICRSNNKVFQWYCDYCGNKSSSITKLWKFVKSVKSKQLVYLALKNYSSRASQCLKCSFGALLEFVWSDFLCYRSYLKNSTYFFAQFLYPLLYTFINLCLHMQVTYVSLHVPICVHLLYKSFLSHCLASIYIYVFLYVCTSHMCLSHVQVLGVYLCIMYHKTHFLIKIRN